MNENMTKVKLKQQAFFGNFEFITSSTTGYKILVKINSNLLQLRRPHKQAYDHSVLKLADCRI